MESVMTPVELQARREALGLSLKALGEVWGVRPQSIARWEYGQNQPKSWDWMDESLSAMEDYLADLIDTTVQNAQQAYEDTGEVALVTYDSRGAFYHWHPAARDYEWPNDGLGVPVELHRVATAHAAVKLRKLYDVDAVPIAAVPKLRA